MLYCIIREQFSLGTAQNVLMGLKHMPLFLFSSLSAWHEMKLSVIFPFHVPSWELYLTENVMDNSTVVYVTVVFWNQSFQEMINIFSHFTKWLFHSVILCNKRKFHTFKEVSETSRKPPCKMPDTLLLEFTLKDNTWDYFHNLLISKAIQTSTFISEIIQVYIPPAITELWHQYYICFAFQCFLPSEDCALPGALAAKPTLPREAVSMGAEGSTWGRIWQGLVGMVP